MTRVAASAGLGAVGGALAGVHALLVDPTGSVPACLPLLGFLFYGISIGALAALLGGFGALGRGIAGVGSGNRDAGLPQRRSGPCRDPVVDAALLVLLVLAVAEVNVRWLPGFLDPLSLGVDAGLVLVAWVLRGAIAGRVRDRTVGGGVRRLGPAVLAVAAVTGVGAAGMAVRGDSARALSAPRGEPHDGPSVLVVVIDTLRADHLGCYGYPRPTSPHLDALAARGALFEHCVSTASHTKPATASLLTGLYPPTHGVRMLNQALDAGVPTLGGWLRRHGYRTAVLSANTLVSPRFGFGRDVDHFEGNERPSLLGLPVAWGFRQLQSALPAALAAPTLAYSGCFLSLEERLRGLPLSDETRARRLNGSLLRWLDEGPADVPFFAYVHYLEPHDPYTPPAGSERRFLPAGASSEAVEHFPSFVGRFLPFDRAPALPPAQRDAMVARYDAEIADVDGALGELLGALADRGFGEDELCIVVTADHGEEFHEHGAWGHGQSLYEELVHVPLVVSGPAVAGASGLRVPGTVSLVDVVPTVLDLVGVPPIPGTQGRSLAPRLRCDAMEAAHGVPVTRGDPGEADLPGDRDAPGELDDGPPTIAEIHWGGHHARAIYDGSRKLVRAVRGFDTVTQLYDLDADPLERHDRVGAEPEEAARLEAALDSAFAALETRAGATLHLGAELRSQLRALGYVE